MFKNSKTILTFLLVILIIILISFLYGRHLGKSVGKIPEKKVTSQVILEKIKDQYFLVTKTMFYRDKIEMIATQNSGWRDFLWGEKITADGVVRIDIGVDINKMDLEDIRINHAEKFIEVDIPQAEILDSSLNGELDIRTEKGIFNNIKDIFVEDGGEDYNKAVKELIETAKYSAGTNEEIYREARKDAVKIIDLILSSLELDYEIKISDYSK